MTRRLMISLLALSVTACVAERTPPPAPRPQPPRPAPPPPTPAPVPADPERTPGSWTYSQDARGSVARFGTSGRDALFVLRCDLAGRRVFASVQGAMPISVTMRASTLARTYRAVPTGSTPAYVAVEFASTDVMLDALAFSRGKFSVDLPGRGLVLPPWPEFGRVVEDCRA